MTRAQIHPVTLPKWGLEMTEGTIVAWHCTEGAIVEKGDDLVDIETDKIVNTLDAETSGTMRRQLVSIGETRPVGALIAVLSEPNVADADVDAFVAAFRHSDALAADEEPADEKPVQEASDGLHKQGDPKIAARNETVNASPFAVQRASELGVDISLIVGTGRGGRISERDVELAAADQRPASPASTGSAPSPSDSFPLSATRRTIAKTLLAAVRDIPHYRVSIDVHADALLAAHRKAKKGKSLPSLNDFLLKAVGLALKDVPDVNIHVHDAEIIRFTHADICFAAATDEGLVAPVVRGVNNMTIAAIAEETARLIAAARARTLAAPDLEGGSFTVSNLGMFGVRAFDAIITPPQGAVLAIGGVRHEAYEREGGNVSFRSVFTATISCDHRAIDGALAARFLAAFRERVEAAAAL